MTASRVRTLWTWIRTYPRLSESTFTSSSPGAATLPLEHAAAGARLGERSGDTHNCSCTVVRPFLRYEEGSSRSQLQATSMVRLHCYSTAAVREHRVSASQASSLWIRAPRHYSTRRGELSSKEDARKFLAGLPVPQRLCLEKAVLETTKVEPEVETPPTWNQLQLCEYE
jgi:hypothetical protein